MAQIFYTPNIQENLELPAVEAGHCLRVLRLKEGNLITLVDGKGNFYDAEIDVIRGKRCTVRILHTHECPNPWLFKVHIAVAPTKNMDRMEWFAEKATEIGIDAITCLLCDHSERKVIKNERLEKIVVSAMKQSQKATIPSLTKGMVAFKDFVTLPFEGKKYIAHCEPDQKTPLTQAYTKGENALILIGPEGDFSLEEIKIAIENGFQPIALGESRLRTETAALMACHILHVVNEIGS